MNDKTEIILAMSVAFLAIPFYFIALFVVNFYNMMAHILVESSGLPDKIYDLTKKKQRDRFFK